MLRFQEQKTQLDLETFAQINNDVESLGTELEGNKFTTTVNFFISWLKQIEFDSKQELIEKFKQLSSVAEIIDEERFLIYPGAGGKKKAIINRKVNAILPEEFLEKITCLADNESILIPGGWLTSRTSGHAMIYELIKNEDSYLLKVYNSGAGLCKHQIKEGIDKKRYAPIKVYEFKLEDPNAKVFIKEFIKELIKPIITPRTQIYGEEEVYNIFESLVRIRAKEVCPYKKGIIKEEIASSGQKSGSCAQKVLHAFFKVHLNDRKLYNQFIYDFKKYSINCYLAKEGLSSLDLAQIKLAIENLARKIDKVGDDEFKSRENKEIIRLFEVHKEALAKLTNTPLKQKTESNEKLSCEFQISPITDSHHQEFKSSFHLEESKQLKIDKFNFSAKDWGKELTRFVKSLSSPQNCTISAIEQFYLDFPINEEIKDKFVPSTYIDKTTLLSNLSSIGKKFFTESNNDSDKLRAFKVIHVAIYSKIFSDVIFLHGPDGVDFLRAIRKNFSTYYNLECVILNGCHDYQLDAQLMRALGILFEQDVRKRSGKIQYIESIILKYGIEKELEELFDQMILADDFEDFVEREDRLGIVTKPMYVIAYIINKVKHLDTLLEKFNLDNKEAFISQINHIKTDFDLYKRMTDDFIRVVSNFDDCGLIFKDFKKPEIKDYFLSFKPFCKLEYKNPSLGNSFLKKIFEGSYIQSYLENWQSIPNSMQIECGKDDKISPSDLMWVRRFQQISASVFRLPEVIRLFFVEMQVYLLDTEKQIFLEKCIFGPMYLARAMQENQSLIEKLYSYIDMSINQYNFATDPKEKTAVLFLLRLKSKIIAYNLDYYNLNYIEYPADFIEKYDKHILELENIIADKSLSFEIAKELMFCKIIMLNYFKAKDRSKLIAQILEYNINEVLLRDPKDSLMVEDIMYRLYLSLTIEEFKTAVEKFIENKLSKANYQIVINAAANGLNILQGETKIGFASLKNFKVHISELSITCKIPYSIRSNAKYKKAVGSLDPEANFYPESNKYEFSYEGNKYTLYCSSGRNIKIFINFNGYLKDVSFELQQNKKWYTSVLPSYLLSDTVNIWAGNDDSSDVLIMQDTDNKKYYVANLYVANLGVGTSYTIEEHDQLFIPKGNLISNFLGKFPIIDAFEPTPHVKVKKKHNQLIIDLLRYGLVFVADIEGKSCKLEGTDLKLIDHPSVIPGFTQQLVIENAQRKFLLLPVAEFIQDQIDKKLDDRGFKKLKLDLNQNVQRMTTPSTSCLWLNNNPFKTKHIKLKMKGDQLFPMNMADGLYLSYVYLATNNYQQAFDMLEYVKTTFRMITGSDHEIDYIRWIISSLPASSEGYDIKERKNPSIVAVQLKALELLIAFKNENRKFKPVHSPIYNSPSPNRDYDQQLYTERKKFFDQVEIKIPIIIEFYCTRLRNVSKSMHLSKNELYTLLNAINVPLSLPIKFLKKCLHTCNNDSIVLHYATENLVEKNELLTSSNVDWPFQYSETKNINENINTYLNIDFLRDMFCKFELPLNQIYKDYVQILHAIDNARKEHKKEMAYLFGRILSDPKYKGNEKIKYLYAFVHYGNRPFGFFDKINIKSGFGQNISLVSKGTFERKVLAKQRQHEEIKVQGPPAKEKVKISTGYCNVKQDCLIKEIESQLPLFDAEFFKPWADKIAETNKAIGDLKAQYIDLQTQPLTYEQRTKKENELEQKAGELFHGLEKSHFLICQSELFKNHIICIKDLCEIQKKYLTPILQNLKTDILALANKELSYKKIGQRNSEITFELLIKLFGRNDKNSYQEITFLQEKDITALHSLMAKYITECTHLAHFERVINIISTIEQLEPSNPVYGSSLYKLGVMLNEKNLVDTIKDPEMQLFQYDQGIFIRQDQLDSINSLLDKNADGSLQNKIIQLIMGAGKTTVLLNLLAIKRADGENLSIIEVPDPLYESNLASLNNITYRLYGKEPFGFKFDRDTPCGVSYLQNLYLRFEKIRLDRKYIVTTKSSIACLELKYQTLFSENGYKTTQNDQAELYWLHKIMKLLKEHGDCLVDEVHNSLDLRQEINFTLGEKQELADKDIKYTCELFEFMEEVAIMSEHGRTTMPNFLNNPDGFSENCKYLVYALVHYENSPLGLNIDDNERQEIENYLLGRTEDIPGILNTLDKNQSDKIKLYRGQICKLLPDTIRLIYRVNYGPSSAENKNIIERQVSIPFAGNEEPKENSQNTNYFKTINLTIQGMLISGISEELLSFLVDKWYKIAINSVKLQKGSITIDESEISKEVSAVLGKQLSEVYKYNPEDFKDFANETKHNKKIIFYILGKEILPTITLEKKIATLNSINYVDIFRSLCGVTGTPNNYRTMNPKIGFDQSKSLGTDGLTCARLKSKNTEVKIHDFESIPSFMREFTIQNSNLRAIIDVAPVFKGIENNKVAAELCQFISTNQNEFSDQIKFLIYFDKQPGHQMAEPFALPIYFSNLESDRIPLKGMSKSEIRTRLESGPRNWFIYFDQLRTVGTDFELMPNAHAILTLDPGSKITDFAQGVNRLRDLKGQQTVTVVVPNSMPASIDEIIALCSNNLSNSLKEEHFDAACAILRNFVRNFLRNMSLDLIDVRHPDAGQVRCYSSAFDEFFFKEQVKSLIEQYGEIDKNIQTEIILKKIMENALCYAKISLAPEMKEYIDKAVKNCAEYNFSQKNTLGSDAQSEQQAQVEQQSKSEQQQKTQSQHSSIMPSHSFRKEYGWLNDIIQDEYNNWSNFLSGRSEFSRWPLGERVNRDFCNWPLFNLLDEDKIYASLSQINTFDNNYSMVALKELQMVMLVQIQGKTNAYLIDYHEANHIQSILNNNECKEETVYVWLAQITGNVVAGKAPDNDKHMYIFEILNYYQGNINYLSEKDMTKSVLFEDLNEKIKGLKEKILPHRLHDPTSLEQNIYLYELLDEILAQVACGEEIDQHKLSLFNKATKTTVNRFIDFIAHIEKGDVTYCPDHEFFKGIFHQKILDSGRNVSRLGVGFYISLSLLIIFTSSIFVFVACLKRNLQDFFNNFKFDLVHKVSLILILLSAVSAIAMLYFVNSPSKLKNNSQNAASTVIPAAVGSYAMSQLKPH